MGGKSQPAPDYGPMKELGQQQLMFAKQQYAETLPIAQRIAQSQIAAQNQQMNQAQDYYNYQQNTFRPVEQGLVNDAQRFNTDAYREQMATQAASAAANAFGTQQAMGQRAMASMGVNPNSGRAMAFQTQGNLGLAAQRANAMTSARQQAEQMGWARRMDVTGLGRGLAGASTAAYAGATGAGSSGLNSTMAPGGQYMQGMAGAGQTFGNVLNNQTSQFNAGLNAEGQVIGGLVGAGSVLGGAALGGKFGGSDRRIKENIIEAGSDTRTGLPLYDFEYKPEFKDSLFAGHGRYRGVMADDVEKLYPDMVFEMPSGFKAVNYAGLGIEMLEV